MNVFLRFLDADIRNNPQETRPFNIQQGKKLVIGMDINIDDETGDDEQWVFRKGLMAGRYMLTPAFGKPTIPQLSKSRH